MKRHGQIDFALLKKSCLEVMQWLFLDQIAFLSNGSRSRKLNGWVPAKQKTIGDHLGVSDRTIRTYISTLCDSGWIEKDDDTKMIKTTDKWFNLLSLKNDDEAEEFSKESGNNFQPDSEEFSAPTIKGEIEGREEDKKTKAKNIEIIDQHRQTAKEAIEYLNKKTGSRFKADLESNLTPIIAKLKAGYTRENIGYVIDVKCQEWMGTDMEKHLNPTTLFRPANFDKYLNQKPKPIDMKQLEVELYERAKQMGMSPGQAALYVSDELTKRGM